MQLSVPSIFVLLQTKRRTLVSASLSIGCIALMLPVIEMAQKTPILNSGAFSQVTGWLSVAILCAMLAFAVDARIHYEPTDVYIDEAISVRNVIAWAGLASIAVAILSLALIAPSVFASLC